MKIFKENMPFFAALLFVLGVLGLGFILFKTAPTQTAQSATATNDMSSHHSGGAGAVTDNGPLNSLIGKALPDITLQDKDGKTYSNTDLKGKYTVLFFNEGLMCYPGCWNQISAFGSDSRFNSADVQAVSVVVDSAKDWQKAIAKMPKLADARTLYDTGASASKQLGMLTTASSMHKGSLPGHTYVLVDKDGIVKYVYDDPNMAIANDSLWGKIQELNK